MDAVDNPQWNRGCNVSFDREFGPAVRCRQFDFTLTFEQSIFFIGVTSLFIIVLPFRFYLLYGSTIKTSFSRLHVVKIGMAGLLLALQVASLALWAQLAITRVAVPAAALSLIGMLAVFALTLFEHSRTVRPSTLICLYILASIVADSVLLRTLHARGYSRSIPIVGVVSTSIATKLCFLVLESTPKTSYLKTKDDYGPEEVTGVFGRGVLWWLNSLFWHGHHNVLTLNDLYPIDHDLRAIPLRSNMQQEWKKRNKYPTSHSLLFALISALKWELLRTFIPRAAIIAFSYAQTFLITAAIHYLETPSNKRNRNHAYGLIGASALIYIGRAISTAQYHLKVYRMVTAFRGATVSIIFTKMLSANSDFKDSAPVTLMSTDVDRIAEGLVSGINMWGLLAEVGVGTWLLWRQLGAVACAPILMVIIFSFAQTLISKRMGPKQGAWVQAVQSRVGAASFVLGSIKSIKLAGLTSSMINLLQLERKKELDMAKKFRWLMVLTTTVANIPNMFSALIVFAAFSIESKVKHTEPLTTAKAFSSLAILLLLNTPAAALLNSFPVTIAALGCVKRIQIFLESEEFQDPRTFMAGKSGFIQPSGDNESLHEKVLKVSNLRLAPETEVELPPPLIKFSVDRATFTLVLGPVGSGKSTLLKAMLGETGENHRSSGKVEARSPFMAYCAQTPWLQSGTIRDNIVGPNDFDEEWYRRVIWLCDLSEDIAQMPHTDFSEAGSRGITLSGGQKHRIALARALYSRRSVLLLDDFVSSLDQNTRITIARRLFSSNGHVRRHKCTVLMATNDESFATLADRLIVLTKDGTLEYYGAPRDWGKFTPESKHVYDSLVSDSPSSRLSTPIGTDSKPGSPTTPVQSSGENKTAEKKRQTGDVTTWIYYAKAIGRTPLFFFILFIVLASLGVEFPKLLLKWSTEEGFTVGKFIGLYFMLVVIAWAAQGAMIAQMMIVVATKSAMTLHLILTRTVLGAPMSFFDSTDASIFLNRFSQDMSMVDMAVPASVFAFVLSVSMCLTGLAFVCIGSKYMAATIPVTALAVFVVGRFYLQTSRQMRLLDLESKSPLYKNFSETMEGMQTIRAFGWQQTFEKNAFQSLDVSQKPYYLLYCIQRWLNLVLDFTTATVGISVVALAVCLPQSSSSGSLGVALTSLLSFNAALQGLIGAYTNAETVIGSVTRTREFEEETPQETSDNDARDPGPNWPQGNIQVSNVSVVYGNGKSGISNVSFEVDSGQKVGIVGRTGSGKSTILQSLLRLRDPTGGTIYIDGIDTLRIPRDILQDRLICLPQDPLVFSKSFQFNLDPENRISDTKELESVLELVKLSTLVKDRGGLSATAATSELSQGEQQLLVLARAILRKRMSNGNCILVLDEATSSIDSATRAIIQDIITTEFRTNTVIQIAHDIDLLLDSDIVVMLDSGRVSRIGTAADIL